MGTDTSSLSNQNKCFFLKKKCLSPGYTLMEVIIVLVLLIILASFLFGTFNFLMTDYVSMQEQSIINQSIFNALDRISRDLKMAKGSSIYLLWPDKTPGSSTGLAGGLSFMADLNNDGLDENYVYYLYHPNDSLLDTTYFTAPQNDEFYRLYKFSGTSAQLTPNYAGHPGVLLAEDVVPPVMYPAVDGHLGSYFNVGGNIAQIRLRVHKEKGTIYNEDLAVETSVYPRN